MPDSVETKILKDINRHLAHIDGKDGMTDRLSPSETAALNKNAGEIIGTFSSLISSETKTIINSGNKQLIDAFGNLKGFDTEVQVDLLDDVVDELKTNNRFMEKGEHNDFLAEAEREQDLDINRRTNELLEDLNDKEDDAAAAAAKSDSDSKAFLGTGLGGLMGGLMAGKSLRGVLGAVKSAGKKLFFPAIAAAAGVEFLRGWAEAGDDASTLEKFNSGIGRTLADLSFGLVSKKFFTDTLEQIEGAIGKAWTGFTKSWDDFVHNKISAPDFFADILSGLSLGTLSAGQLKSIGQQIEDGMIDLVATIVAAVTDGIVTPLMDALALEFETLLSDPVAYFRDIWRKRKEEEKKELDAKSAEIQKLMDEGRSEESAKKEVGWLDFMTKYSRTGFFSASAVKIGMAAAKKLGAFSETQEEYNLKAAKEAEAKQKSDAIKAKAAAVRAANLKKAREAETQPISKPISAVGYEGLKQRIAASEERRIKRQEQVTGGNAMQINQNTNVAVPVDRQTENDDRALQRSYNVEGSE
jgi:hypothetical protein